MSNEALAVVTIRVVGLWAGFFAVATAGSTVRSFVTAEPSLPFEAIPTAAIWLALALYMIVAPSHLARRLLPKDYDEQGETKLDLAGFKSVMLGALGLFLIITAISHFGSSLYSWADLFHGGYDQPIRADYLVGFIIEMVAGVWLLMGARGLGGVFRTAPKTGSD